jgi:hypothetical protein
LKYFSLPSEADTSEADTSEADTSEADTSERKMSVMFTIKVLITSLPGGYKPIIDAYIAQRALNRSEKHLFVKADLKFH